MSQLLGEGNDETPQASSPVTFGPGHGDNEHANNTGLEDRLILDPVQEMLTMPDSAQCDVYDRIDEVETESDESSDANELSDDEDIFNVKSATLSQCPAS